jgi:hypothetical protein
MGFANNVVPSFIMNDPEKLAEFLESHYANTGQARPDQGEFERLEEQLKRNADAVSSIRIGQEVIPGMEDYTVEDDTPDPQYMDDLGTGNLTTTIYRIVNARGNVERSSTSSAFNKPYYSTLKGARSALTYLRRRATGNFRLQKGEVTWQEL